MPDILIRGMELPHNCIYCPLRNGFVPRGITCKITGSNTTTHKAGEGKQEDCPLHELPPHGDLISSENVIEIIERLRDKSGNDEMAFALNWALRLIREKPVIVPSNKEETP